MKVGLSVQTFDSKEITNVMVQHSSPESTEIKKKYGFDGREKIRFQTVDLDAWELYQALTRGHTITHYMIKDKSTRKKKDGSLDKKNYYSMQEKTNENFGGTWFIPIDIDETRAKSVEQYLGALTYKPTFWYTTYSHLKDGKGVRFRMVYCFNRMMIGNSYIKYRWCSSNLIKTIESETGERVDHASLNAAQYFNGVNEETADNFEKGWIGKIYNWYITFEDELDCYKAWLDLGCDYDSERSIENNLLEIKKEGGNPPQFRVITDIDEELLTEYISWGCNEIYREKNWKYSLPEETHPTEWDKTIDRQWLDPSERYVKIWFYLEKVKKGNRAYNLTRTGEQLRLINLDCTPSQVFYMLTLYNEWILEEKLGWKELVFICDSIFNTSMEEILEKNKAYLEYCEKHRPRFVINPFLPNLPTYNEYLKMDREKEIEKTYLYDPTLTREENYNRIKQVNPNVTRESIKKYHTSHRQSKDERKKEEIINSGLLNVRQSFRQNLKRLRDNGYKVSQDTLRNILKYDKDIIPSPHPFSPPSSRSREVVVICNGLDRLF